jgi:hypothetical protein
LIYDKEVRTIITDKSLAGLNPAASENRPGRKEVIMKKNKKIRKPDYGCDSRCVFEYVECVDKEDGASICKTRERNCLNECHL